MWTATVIAVAKSEGADVSALTAIAGVDIEDAAQLVERVVDERVHLATWAEAASAASIPAAGCASDRRLRNCRRTTMLPAAASLVDTVQRGGQHRADRAAVNPAIACPPTAP